MDIDIQELLNAKNEQIREKKQKIKDIEEAILRLRTREVLKKQALDKAVLVARNEAKKEVIDLVKSKIPASPLSYYKPTARAVLRDLHRVIQEEEEELKKSAKKP
jgi:hypothetical protein